MMYISKRKQIEFWDINLPKLDPRENTISRIFPEILKNPLENERNLSKEGPNSEN